MPGRKVGSKSVSLRDFLVALVEVHNEGGTLTTVAEQLGVTPAAVSSRVKSLRDKGVKLPEFERSRSSNVLEDARNILSELGVEQGDEDEDEDEDIDEVDEDEVESDEDE
jgi:DNA-binding MarR family transcriptional regulator